MPPGTPFSHRPLTLDDADLVADVMSEADPDDPADPAGQRAWLKRDDLASRAQRYVIELEGRPVGFAGHSHPRWEEVQHRYGRVLADLRPPHRTAGHLDSLIEWAEAMAREDGVATATMRVRESDVARLDVTARRGYREQRRGHWWQLDLEANREPLLAMARESRAKMAAHGVELLTVDRTDDPEIWRRMHALSNQAIQDIPTTVPIQPESFEAFMTEVSSPAVRPDRVWVARSGDEVVGISYLEYPPQRGHVWTGWTCTARSVRGRGVARAVKVESVVQALELGVGLVRTENDGENEPILHLNHAMGYRPIPGMVEVFKEL